MTGHLIPNYWTARPDVYGRYVPAVRPTLNELFSPIAKVVLGVLGILLITSSNAPAQSNENPLIETFAVYSKPKAIHHIDVGLEGKSHGDILIFEAIFADENKNMVGRLTGKLITGTLPDSITNSNQTHEDRFRTLVYEFDDGGTIIINGLAKYSIGESMMALNYPLIQAITGGTGKYMGVRGQVTTTRIADESYEHKFELLQ